MITNPIMLADAAPVDTALRKMTSRAALRARAVCTFFKPLNEAAQTTSLNARGRHCS